MKSTIKNIYFKLILALLIPAVNLCAQQATSPAAPETPDTPEKQDTVVSGRPVEIRSIYFNLDKPLNEIYAHSKDARVDQNGSAVPPACKLSVKKYLNHEYDMLGIAGDKIIFTASPDHSSINDPKQVLGEADLYKTVDSAILLFLDNKDPNTKGKYKTLVIEDTIQSFPRGSMNIINISDLDVMLMLEEEKFPIRRMDRRLIINPPVGASNASAMLAFTAEDGEIKRVGSGIWPHPGSKRILLIAYKNERANKLQIQGIRDVAVSDTLRRNK